MQFHQKKINTPDSKCTSLYIDVYIHIYIIIYGWYIYIYIYLLITEISMVCYSGKTVVASAPCRGIPSMLPYAHCSDTLIQTEVITVPKDHFLQVLSIMKF